MRLGAALLLALGSSAALNWGYFVQHGAAAALPPLRLDHPLRSLASLFASARWFAGFAAGIGGWTLYVAALALAPLSLVQAVSASGIGVLAVLVQLSPGAPRLSSHEWGAAAAAAAGLLLLGLSLSGADRSGSPPVVETTAVMTGAAVTAAVLAAGVRRPSALGAAAGILYATGDVATKTALATSRVVFVPAVLASHGLAFVCLQLGFQRGSALSTAGPASLLTNALPIAAGTVLFDERMPSGSLGDLRLTAFALVSLGAALLARA